MALKVLLLETQPLLIEALQGILKKLDDAVAIDLVPDLTELRDRLLAAPDERLVFLSQMSSTDGLPAVVSELRRAAPTAKIVLYGDCTDRDRVRQLYICGADAVIPHQATGNIVAAATRLVLAGGKYLPPEVFGPTWQATESEFDPIEAGDYRLTPQQRKVLALLAEGLSNRQIAERLGIAEGTVKLHVNAILKALDVPNRTAAALVARGLSSPPLPIDLRRAG